MPNLPGAHVPPSPEQLERQVAKLSKINAALMQRVEKSMDQQANAYSLFQTAIALEEQVRARTEELQKALSNLERTNDALMSARDVTERASRFKTRFFTAVGHDLLQPLHAARLSVTALAEIDGTPRKLRLALGVENALSTIEDLLKSILDISKLEAGVMTPTLQTIQLDDLFSSLSANVGPLARSKKLDFAWRSTPYTVTSDPLMLQRILQNLLSNAVQYTSKGGVRLTARPRQDEVRIEVWDTGPGIPPAHLERIFEEFQRGPTSDRPVVGGFGLGLSIVQLMARTLGHRVGICSRIGHGTRFSISVPLAGKIERREDECASIVKTFQPYGIIGAKVAVIDNDPAVLEAMRSLLERWSCEPHLLRGLDDIEHLLRKQDSSLSIVLADYHLDHGTCGLDAVKLLREKLNPQLPAIVVTADHNPDVAREACEAGCEVLLKPVKPAELRALMLHVLSQPSNRLAQDGPTASGTND